MAKTTIRYLDNLHKDLGQVCFCAYDLRSYTLSLLQAIHEAPPMTYHVHIEFSEGAILTSPFDTWAVLSRPYKGKVRGSR